MKEPTEPHLVTREPQTCAVVREQVPMSELTDFFDRVFHRTMAAAAAQGRQVVGPPFAAYFGTPTDTVDVAGGFPVDAAIEPGGDVTSLELPGGRAVELLHVGTYDALAMSYGRMMAWMGQQGLAPGTFMWESYLTEPDPDAPESAQTLITMPVA